MTEDARVGPGQVLEERTGVLLFDQGFGGLAAIQQ